MKTPIASELIKKLVSGDITREEFDQFLNGLDNKSTAEEYEKGLQQLFNKLTEESQAEVTAEKIKKIN
jgi:hypothetical protein